MKKIPAIFAATLISMTATTGVHAFGLNVPGLGGGGSKSAPAADLGGQQTALLKTYSDAGQTVLAANTHFGEALQIKEVVERAKVTSDQLKGGATKDSLSSTAVTISETTQSISDALKANPTLDKAAKATYAKGLVTLVSGIKKYAGMSTDVSNMSSALSANPLSAANYAPSVTVVKDFPTSMKTLKESLTNAIAFAKANDIPVPADANNAF
jgi:hypothetical protein